MGDENAPRESTEGSWPELPLDVYELISSKLPLRSILRWKAVCHSCYDAITYILEKSPSFTWLAEPPCLLLYPDKYLDLPDDFDVDDGITYDQGYVLYNIDIGKFSRLKNTIPKELSDGVFIGSSQGWVVFLSNKLEFVLLNPLLCGVQLSLAPLSSFPDIQSVTYDLKRPIVKWRKPAVTFTSLERLEARFPTKVVVCPRWSCSDDRRRNKDIFGVVVIYFVECGTEESTYTPPCSLAFCKINGGPKWTKLDEHGGYITVTCHQNHLYGFYTDYESVAITVWGFDNSSVPLKLTDIQTNTIERLEDFTEYWCDPRVIKTPDDLFLIWTNDFGTFYAYKLDCSNDGHRWTEVESIGNYALVLDERQSMLIASHEASRWGENSVYLVVQTQQPCLLPNVFVGFNLMERVKEEYDDLPYAWKRLKLEYVPFCCGWKIGWPVFLG